MINSVCLTGRLTREVDLKYTANGVAVATFTLAVNRNFKNQNGEREADFINCVAWRSSAEYLANFSKKGDLIGLQGRIQTRNYENQQGQRIYLTEVVADTVENLTPKSSQETQQNSAGGFKSNSQGNYNQNNQSGANRNLGGFNDFGGSTIDISDDDLPF